jgi:hypothetical protein
MYGKTSQKNYSKINENSDDINKDSNEVCNNDDNKENGNEEVDDKEKKERKIIVPYHLKKITTMCASESLKDLILLFKYFELTVVLKGGVLWNVGDTSVSAILLCKGGLISHSLSEKESDDNKDNNELLCSNDNITYDNDRNTKISSSKNNNNINNNNYQNIGSENGIKNGSGKDRHVIKINDTEIEKGGRSSEKSSERGREREDDEEHGEDFEEIYIGHLIGRRDVCVCVYVYVYICLCKQCVCGCVYESVCMCVCAGGGCVCVCEGEGVCVCVSVYVCV